ncbi:C6 zinc finger domain protein [Aspergillus coremiiformis]|uniref:C6 zinc finger domain protein n=1 Tax=Aspergillus coremiiformis TaxID=138285 RepID=A0A5N6Z0U0_9EURO|nr:C6 zinc finger domain protein [Aspergillus coremiiformis]
MAKNPSECKKPSNSKPRTKSGCRTCRIRRVKCDEARPSCRRCISTGRSCDGYGVWGGGSSAGRRHSDGPQAYNVLTQRAALSIAHPMSDVEKVYWEWFIHRSAVKLRGVFSSTFWDALVVQASLEVPAVLHAVLALSSVHKHGLLGMDGSKEACSRLDPREQFTLRQYNKSICYLRSHLAVRTREAIHVTLITCMIFICLEAMRGRYTVGRVHLQNGLKLLREIMNGIPIEGEDAIMLRADTKTIDNDLVDAIARFNLHSALFGYSLEPSVVIVQDPERRRCPLMFQSVKHARQHLEGFFFEIHCLQDRFHRIQASGELEYQSELYERQHRLQANLVTWLGTYKASYTHLKATMNGRDTLADKLLHAYYIIATVMASTCLTYADESIYDSYTEAFLSVIVRLIDILVVVSPGVTARETSGRCMASFSFIADMGLIPPLYYTAIKCRVPRIRRQAAKLLISAAHREGLLDGSLAARIVVEVINMEEGDFYRDTHIAEDFPIFDYPEARELAVPVLPESRRVYNIRTMLPTEPGGSIVLVCSRKTEYGTQEVLQKAFH